MEGHIAVHNLIRSYSDGQISSCAPTTANKDIALRSLEHHILKLIKPATQIDSVGIVTIITSSYNQVIGNIQSIAIKGGRVIIIVLVNITIGSDQSRLLSLHLTIIKLNIISRINTNRAVSSQHRAFALSYAVPSINFNWTSTHINTSISLLYILLSIDLNITTLSQNTSTGNVGISTGSQINYSISCIDITPGNTYICSSSQINFTIIGFDISSANTYILARS